LGRWVAGLRITAAWLAGINKMAWPRFVFWNALGGVAWATSVGLTIYFVGHAAKGAIEGIGLGALGVGAAIALGYAIYRAMRRRPGRAAPRPSPASGRPAPRPRRRRRSS